MRILPLSLILVLLHGCGGGEEPASTEETPQAQPAKAQPQAQPQKAPELKAEKTEPVKHWNSDRITKLVLVCGATAVTRLGIPHGANGITLLVTGDVVVWVVQRFILRIGDF